MPFHKLKPSLTFLCILIIIVGLGSRIYSYALTVSNYPLTTDWSESGRIFEAALVYAPIVFGRTLPWPWLDTGRAILDGLVFLIPNGQIWMYRFWLVCLSLSTTALAASLIMKRALQRSPLKNRMDRFLPILLVAWGILYILQCSIYYHLLLGVIVVLWLLDLDKPILVLGAVIFASAWEGLCRVNWFLMPAVLVVTIYLLVAPVTGRQITRYLMWPAIWLGAGALASFLSYGLFIKFSHYVISFFNPNMHYGFFRFKLWPNAGFGLGLIPGIILLSIPVIALLFIAGLRRIRSVHWIRSLALLGILAVLFIGSTIVSLRAGGGFDLHNYDSFVLILFVVGSYWGLGAVGFDKSETDPPKPLLENRFVLLGLLVIPIFFALSSIPARANYPEKEANNAIQEVQSVDQKTDTSKGPVLFIDYRHLLVYRMIPPVEFYLPYEKIDLMEMAMANNNPYLHQFWKDVQEQRFSLIVSEVMVDSRQDIQAPYGYENNVWSENLSFPILEYYQPVYVNRSVGLAVYEPKVK